MNGSLFGLYMTSGESICMGQMLAAMLNLQSMERDLAQVRRRLKSRENAVMIQQRKIDQRREEWNVLHESILAQRVRADELSMDLKAKEERVSKLRSSLNTARTNKQYAAILTQMNTIKADNARIEDEALRMMQQIEQVETDAENVQAEIEVEEHRLAAIRRSSEAEIERLNKMFSDLSSKRDRAAEAVPRESLTTFNRVAERYDGEAMAQIKVQGRKAPYSYVCAGCYMALNAEHANALRVRDEIRTCNNCGRILFISAETE